MKLAGNTITQYIINFVIFKHLDNENWSVQFEALNTVKRMVGHHKGLIQSSTLHPVVI